MQGKTRGVATVEFALVLPVLLLLAFLAVEFGRALYQYDVLAKSARAGARYLSMQSPGTHVTQARNLVIHGNTEGTGDPLVPGLTAANVPAPTWQEAGTAPLINTVTVRITGYAFQPMFASAFGVDFPALAFPAIAATMRSQP